MRSFLNFLNEDFLVEGFSSEMKSVFTKAELANAGRAASYDFNVEKTNFKEADPSIITKSSKTLDRKVVLVKTTKKAYIIKYRFGADHPILIYDLTVNTKSDWVNLSSAKGQESRKDIADNAKHVFVSTEEVYDRWDIRKDREMNKPDDEPSDWEAKQNLKDRLAKFKFDKEHEKILLDPSKSYTENGELIAEKVKKYIVDKISAMTISKIEFLRFDEFKSLAGKASSYAYYMEDFEKGNVTDWSLKSAKKYFDEIIKVCGK